MNYSTEEIVEAIDNVTEYNRKSKAACNDVLALARGRLLSLNNDITRLKEYIKELEYKLNTYENTKPEPQVFVPKRGDVVTVINKFDNEFCGIYLYGTGDYYCVLVDEFDAPQDFDSNEWVIRKVGGSVNLSVREIKEG